MKTIHFVRLLESLYPNGCYTSEQQRQWSNTLNGMMPLWDYNWVGKRNKIVHDDILKRWPPTADHLLDDISRSGNINEEIFSKTEMHVNPLAPKDGLDEPTRSGVVREISRGVGCGYIVKIDLSQDQMDELVEDNAYDTDDTESEDETLLEEEYMKVAAYNPVLHQKMAFFMLQICYAAGFFVASEADRMLNSELKYLYTAVTRPRVNLWIYDEDNERKGPIFRFLQRRQLCETITDIDSATAEGVEHSDQLDILRAEGCGQIQGYLFSRPIPAQDVDALLDKLDGARKAA